MLPRALDALCERALSRTTGCDSPTAAGAAGGAAHQLDERLEEAEGEGEEADSYESGNASAPALPTLFELSDDRLWGMGDDARIDATSFTPLARSRTNGAARLAILAAAEMRSQGVLYFGWFRGFN